MSLKYGSVPPAEALSSADADAWAARGASAVASSKPSIAVTVEAAAMEQSDAWAWVALDWVCIRQRTNDSTGRIV